MAVCIPRAGLKLGQGGPVTKLAQHRSAVIPPPRLPLSTIVCLGTPVLVAAVVLVGAVMAGRSSFCGVQWTGNRETNRGRVRKVWDSLSSAADSAECPDFNDHMRHSYIIVHLLVEEHNYSKAYSGILYLS